MAMELIFSNLCLSFFFENISLPALLLAIDSHICMHTHFRNAQLYLVVFLFLFLDCSFFSLALCIRNTEM